MTAKTYLSAQQLLEDSFELGAKILADGFRPTIITAIWRGGTPMGIAVQELLDFMGVETDHIAIRTSSYAGIEQRGRHVRVHGNPHRCTAAPDTHDIVRSVAALINQKPQAKSIVKQFLCRDKFFNCHFHHSSRGRGTNRPCGSVYCLLATRRRSAGEKHTIKAKPSPGQTRSIQ